MLNKNNQLTPISKQQGQSSILAIAIMLMVITGIYTLYNVSQVTTEKTNLVNATDAAAYSSGVQVARNLNYIAYTNRAMMANHIAVGHLTSYYSWVDYGEASSEILKDLPGIGGFFILAYGMFVGANTTADVAIPIAVRIADLLNLAFYGQQFLAKNTINIETLSELQTDILQVYNTDITLLEGAAPDYLSQNMKLLSAQNRQLADMGKLEEYLDRYKPTDDDEVMKDLIDRSVDALERFRPDRWMRSADESSRDNSYLEFDEGPLEVKVGKDGRTVQTITDEGLNWETEDTFTLEAVLDLGELEIPVFTFDSLDYPANTKEDIYESYRGIRYYTSVKEGQDLEECYRPSLSSNGFVNELECHGITVIAKRDLGNARLMQKGPQDHEFNGEAIFAVARAEIFYHRPHTMPVPGWGDDVEYANMFNPFWKARLSD